MTRLCVRPLPKAQAYYMLAELLQPEAAAVWTAAAGASPPKQYRFAAVSQC